MKSKEELSFKPGVMLSIGELAARTGTSVSGIRFYADKALIPAVRSNSGHRVFARSVVRRVSFILIAQKLGYSLAQISKALLALPEERTPNKTDWSRLSRTFSQDIQRKIDELETLKSKLDGCIGCGCLSLASCELYNKDDAAANLGAGPRYLLGDKPSDLADINDRT